jgi:hypothetical protein
MLGKISKPTRDPAVNPVTALATFHVGQFLEDIVGVVTTRGDMSATFPTKSNKVPSE